MKQDERECYQLGYERLKKQEDEILAKYQIEGDLAVRDIVGRKQTTLDHFAAQVAELKQEKTTLTNQLEMVGACYAELESEHDGIYKRWAEIAEYEDEMNLRLVAAERERDEAKKQLAKYELPPEDVAAIEARLEELKSTGAGQSWLEMVQARAKIRAKK